MSSKLEKLFNLMQSLEAKADLKRVTKTWEDLPDGIRKALDKAMNIGIPREKAVYRVSNVDGVTLCLAEYKDEKNNFTASYLVYGSDVLYVNES
ncbi:MAG: hypothetical protein ABI543_14210 [Ignavibacteria bacterium]